MAFESVTGGGARDTSLAESIEAFWITQLIGVAVRLGIPDALGGGPSSGDQLASVCGADPFCLARLMSGLQSVGICTKNDLGQFELSDRGYILRQDVPGSIRGRALFTSGIMWDLYSHLHSVLVTGRPISVGRKGFNDLAAHPGLHGMHQAMVESSILAIGCALKVFDFGRYGSLLDVGGGYGGALVALLQRFSALRGNVIDLSYLEGGAEAHFRNCGVAERARFISGDFFEEIPPGYACYLLKYVIHDWSDGEAQQILRNCAEATRGCGEVILIERVRPEVVVDSSDHRAIMQLDLAMMATGGRERTVEEYRHLLMSAGLQLVSVTATDSPSYIFRAASIA